MAASSQDRFTRVGNPGSATTLAAPGHTIGGTAITVGSTSNWDTITGQIFAMDTVTIVNGKEVRDVGSYTEWEGVVSSSTSVTSLVLRYGTDQNYPAGSTTRVYIPVSSSRENRLVDGILVSLDQDGTLKAGAVDNTAAIADGVVTSAKIADGTIVTTDIAQNGVGANNLATSAITLGYAQTTTTFTTTNTSATAVTGLTVTVTIPAGGRRVRVTAYTGGLTNQTGGQYAGFTIWDGTVGSGTLLTQGNSGPTANNNQATTISTIITPAAGSKTYNVGIQTTGGQGGVTAASNNPAYILVEAI